LLAVALLLAFFGLWKIAAHVTQHVLANTDRDVRPFVSEQVHYIPGKDGQETIVAQETVARSQAGAVVHAGDLRVNGKVYSGLRKIEYPDGFAGLIIDSIKAKSTGHRPDKLAVENTPKDCAMPPVEVVDGEETLLGQHAIRVRAGNDLQRFIFWRLPDFDCTTVQATLQQRATPTADWVTMSRSQLVKFAAIDPDPALFSGFAHYSEMGPNMLARKYLATESAPQK
jgi:hypothetical protein